MFEGLQDFLHNEVKINYKVWHMVNRTPSSALSTVLHPVTDAVPRTPIDSLNNLTTYYAFVCKNNIIPDSDGSVAVWSQSQTFLSADTDESNFAMEEVAYACKHISSKRSMGTDDLCGLFIKHGDDSVHSAVCVLVNAVWSTGYWPLVWRQANVSSLFKSGKRSDPSNYRPISVTSVLARMLERMVTPKLYALLSTNLCDTQFGFRPERCTEYALLALQHYICQARADKNSMPVAFLDMAKAIDTVSHEGLLYKLNTQFGVTGRLHKFITGFLTDRELRCVIDSAAADYQPVGAGVPQGSVLGPLLFLAYINDLMISIHHCNCVPLGYADDLGVVPLCVSKNDAKFGASVYNLQRALNECYNWSVQWCM